MFEVGAMMMSLKYFLMLTTEPSYGTYTWTLDYNKLSDFDDNVGHWQIMKHPSKPDWSRVLYSCELKLPQWVPAVVVNIFTKTALVESTTWVKRESERVSKRLSQHDREEYAALSWAEQVLPVYTTGDDGSLVYEPKAMEANPVDRASSSGSVLGGLGAAAVEL